MSGASAWRWSRRHGSAAELHATGPPKRTGRFVHEQVVDRPALVLGSSQSAGDVDTDAAVRAGVSVVQRRSGGGAVLLVPGEHVWLDMWLPSTDPLWIDDVGRAGDWLAAVWIAALTATGFPGLEAHRGPMRTSEWSGRVCFAGLGPGEVTLPDGRKLVGMSQRRTRDWARFQCLVHRRWDATAVFGLLSTPGAAAGAAEWQKRVGEIGDAPVSDAVAVSLDSLT